MPKVLTSAKALIFNQDKFLLIREKIEDQEIWDLPGGKIEHGESPQEAVKREVKEELYIDVEVGKSVGVWWFISEYGKKNQIVCHTFRCTPPKEFKIDFNHNPAGEEMVGYEWFTKEEFLSRKLFGVSPSLRELIATL